MTEAQAAELLLVQHAQLDNLTYILGGVFVIGGIIIGVAMILLLGGYFRDI